MGFISKDKWVLQKRNLRPDYLNTKQSVPDFLKTRQSMISCLKTGKLRPGFCKDKTYLGLCLKGRRI